LPKWLSNGDRHQSDKKIRYRQPMVDHLKNLLRGASSVLSVVPDGRRYQLERRGSATDAERLREDFATVGRGLRKQLRRESADYSTR